MTALKIIILLASLTLTSAWAQIQEILIATNNTNEEMTSLKVLSHSGRFNELKIQTFLDFRHLEDRDLFLYEDNLRLGSPILTRQGRNIIYLRFKENFDLQYGGPIEIRFLYNGLTNSYVNLQLDVLKDGNDWIVLDQGRKITRLNILARYKFGREIGIREIETLEK